MSTRYVRHIERQVNCGLYVYEQFCVTLKSAVYEDNMDGIMHKWANPQSDDFEKKSRCNIEYMIKRINTN